MANFYDRVAAAADRFPTLHAVELQTPDALIPTTYRQLTEEAAAFAAWLHGRGIVADDRVAILGDNDARWIAVYFGILRLGAIAVPLDTAYKSGQVRTVLENSGARLIFTTTRYEDGVRAACAGLSPAPDVRLMHELPPAAPAPPVVARGDQEAAVILYTSGTTSDPKGVVLTHGNLEAERQAAFSVVTVTETDAVLGVLPLFHSLAQMANLLLPLAVGGRVVFLQSVNSTALLEALQQRQITIFACVPQFFYLIHQRVMGEVAKANPVRRAVFRVLLRTNGWLRERTGWNPGRRWFAKVHAVLGSHMRFLVTGGSRFDPAIGRDLYDMGFALLNAYGLTETSGGATIVRPGDRYTTSVGQPLKDVAIRIAPQEPGADREQEDGEILIRGPIVMREYFRRPDATGDTLKDGWLHTGDLGRLDADGRLYITGRKKEMIVLASGKNLYPEEIEAHYREADVIKELCVLGLSRPGEPIGERLHAVIVADENVLRERGVVNVQQLVRFEVESRSVHLPAHKRILTYDIWVEPLPRTTTGKVKRHAIEKRLREQAVVETSAETVVLSDEETTWLTAPTHAEAMQIIATLLKRPTVRPDANLDLDLALDSMERVELLTALERQHGCRVLPETRATIFTARHLVDAVLAARSARAEGRSPGAAAPGAETMWESILHEPIDPELEQQLRHTPFLRTAFFFVIVRTIAGVVYLLTRGRSTGRNHLPDKGPFVISPNHQSYLDGFVLLGTLPFGTLRQIFAVGAAEYYQTPFMKWAARVTNVIPVDADANLERAMKAGASGLRLGKVLMLFPEGERSIDGELKAFKKGAAILSAHCQAPIVPVAMDGLFELWPRSRPFNWRGLLPWRATPVRLDIGPSLSVVPGKYAEGTQALRDAVARMCDALRRRSQ
ncbi:MAG: AMP-binding protein [Acidimicrobiia bacterium]|nr:AMP-binding protein [Acidimicrobiia bacterium]